METTDPEQIREFLRELGLQLQRPVRLYVGGSDRADPARLSFAADRGYRCR